MRNIVDVQDLFQAPMLALVEAVGGGTAPPPGVAPLPGGCTAALPVQPLSMDILDSLSVHSKMSLLHHIVRHMLDLAGNKSAICLRSSHYCTILFKV